MTRGNGTVTKVFYKGNTDDFVVFVESPEELEQWKKDKSIPLSQVVNSFKVLVTHKHGAQGQLDSASKASLENEFGTANEDEVIKKILEGGQPQSVQVRLTSQTCVPPIETVTDMRKFPQTGERSGDRNETMGPRQGHPSA